MSQIKDVITSRVRPLLDDTDTTPANQDWLDAQLVIWYNDAIRVIRSMRPDAFIDEDGDEIDVVDAMDVTQGRILDDRWMGAETEYICYLAFNDDAGDHRDADRSAGHLAQFNRLVENL